MKVASPWRRRSSRAGWQRPRSPRFWWRPGCCCHRASPNLSNPRLPSRRTTRPRRSGHRSLERATPARPAIPATTKRRPAFGRDGETMAIRDWLAAFSKDVVEVQEPVATDLEATRFLLRHPRQPVHLRNLQGGEAVGNLWSTRDRVAAALRVSNADLLPKLMEAQAHPKDARVVARAGFMRHETTDVDLRELPIPKLFPKDAGRYVTAGVWVAEWEGARNLSFHRILVLGANRGACRIVPRHLRHMYAEAMKAGGEVKVAVCIGLDPWNLLAGGTSVEYGVDESRIASALTQSCLGKPVDMVRIKNGLTEGGCAWLHGVVSIRKQHQGDGKNAIMAAFGAHTSMKQVVIVDEDIDIFDDRDVEWAIATRFQADRGLVVLHDVRGSSIDPSARDGFTSKMGIDATKPLGGNPAMFDRATL